MPAALKIQNHSHYLDIWNQALSSTRGLAVSLPTQSAAMELRHRLYYARKAQQRENRKIYPADHQMHGNSYFDSFVVKVKPSGDTWEVRIERAPPLELLDMREL